MKSIEEYTYIFCPFEAPISNLYATLNNVKLNKKNGKKLVQ